MAETAPEPRKAELSQMAEILEWVPEHPARNFREALQSVQIFPGHTVWAVSSKPAGPLFVSILR